MLAQMFNTVNKARFNGIRIVPEKAPTLYQASVKNLVAKIIRTKKVNKRVPELQHLPTVALAHVCEEMCNHSALIGVLQDELTDPRLFMPLFTGLPPYRAILERCLRVVSDAAAGSSGKPVLSELASNYCDMMQQELEQLEVDGGKYSPFMCRLNGALALGAYLLDVGWARSSVCVLNIARQMIASMPEADGEARAQRDALQRECIMKLLRAEGNCMPAASGKTCDTLLALMENVTDVGLLVKAYLQVAYHHYCNERNDQCHEWALKAMNLMSSSTATEDVIEVLQLEAHFCFVKQRFDLGSMLISQAIHYSRDHYGTVHPRYVDVLRVYGQSLLKMNATSEAITTFTELLDKHSQLYGKMTPQVPIFEGYLAWGLYLRSHVTTRFDMALDHINDAISLAEKIMPNSKQVIKYFHHIRNCILEGPKSEHAAKKERKPMKPSCYQKFTFEEIREKYVELDASFAVEAIASN